MKLIIESRVVELDTNSGKQFYAEARLTHCAPFYPAVGEAIITEAVSRDERQAHRQALHAVVAQVLP